MNLYEILKAKRKLFLKLPVKRVQIEKFLIVFAEVSRIIKAHTVLNFAQKNK